MYQIASLIPQEATQVSVAINTGFNISIIGTVFMQGLAYLFSKYSLWSITAANNASKFAKKK